MWEKGFTQLFSNIRKKFSKYDSEITLSHYKKSLEQINDLVLKYREKSNYELCQDFQRLKLLAQDQGDTLEFVVESFSIVREINQTSAWP